MSVFTKIRVALCVTVIFVCKHCTKKKIKIL